jgi:hypothetical protein
MARDEVFKRRHLDILWRDGLLDEVFVAAHGVGMSVDEFAGKALERQLQRLTLEPSRRRGATKARPEQPRETT